MIVNIEEAIKHCEEVAEKQEITAKSNLIEIDKIKADGILRLYDADEYESCMKCASDHRQLAEWLRELKAYKIKFEFIISQLEERARQLEDILEKNSWCDGDEEYRLDEINSVVEFIKKTYESKSVLDKEVNADDSNGTN